MLIGALTGFTVFSIFTMITLSSMQRRADTYNNRLLNRRLESIWDGKLPRAKVTIYYDQIAIKAIVATSIGAVIGYFI